MNQAYECAEAVYGVSFVDITATGVTRGNNLERNQQRNWETVLQTFGLLSQPIILTLPQLYHYDENRTFIGSDLFRLLGKEHQFVCEMINPNTNFWVFTLGCEHKDVYSIDRLEKIFDMVPVIPNLTETIRLNPSAFHTFNDGLKNILFLPARQR